MFTRNMKASSRPMSACSFSAESVQVPTPMAIVIAVNTAALPRWRIAASKASRKLDPWSRISCWICSKR